MLRPPPLDPPLMLFLSKLQTADNLGQLELF
jgi:hypothetical protein